MLFTDCKTTVPFLKVDSDSADFQSTGYIVCEKDRVIKNKVQNFAGHRTECLRNASWKHENMFECWGGVRCFFLF